MDAGGEGHAFGDLDPVGAEFFDFGGVVGEEADALHAEVAQDVGGGPVFAFVGLVAEHQVGLDGIEPLVLQIVGAQLFCQPDPTAFLSQIDNGPLSEFSDALHGPVQLFAAIAAQRTEGVAGHAFGVDAHEHVVAAGELSEGEGEVFLAIPGIAVVGELEDPVGGRDTGAGGAHQRWIRAGQRVDHARFSSGMGRSKRTFPRTFSTGKRVWFRFSLCVMAWLRSMPVLLAKLIA